MKQRAVNCASHRMRMLLAVWLLLVCAGCYSHPTVQQRTRSLAALDLPADEQEQFALRILSRTVYLERWQAEGKALKTSKSAGLILTSDGYLLTASHCVPSGSGVPFIAFADDPQELVMMPIRVVWRGNSGGGATDLAVLKIDRQGLMPFDWADDEQIRPDAVVVGAGSCHGDYLTLAAGRVRKVSDMSAAPPVKAIAIVAPIGKGDSGGPWVSSEGKLMGVAARAAKEISVGLGGIQASQAGILLRPDPQWLNSLIEEDRRNHPSGQRSVPFMKVRRVAEGSDAGKKQ